MTYRPRSKSVQDATPQTPSNTRTSDGRERALVAPLERGATLGRLVILGLRGEGGMGCVYAAYDPELDRKVAVKLLRREASQSREELLLREGRAMARLSHPNIVTVFDVGTLAGRVFITMELVEGQTLGQWTRDEKRSCHEVLRCFAQAGRGLAAAHAAGIVHRDFKPDNVLVSDDGRARVADFGLALPLSISTSADNPVEGTPAYMSPEQRLGAPVDARSDQYSFCVALREALDRSTSRDREALPPSVHAAIARGLRADPVERWPTMDALLAALPEDSERDASVSNGPRAVLIGAIVTLQFSLGLVVDPPSRDPAALGRATTVPSGAQLIAWVIVTLAVLAVVLAFARRRLLANRISRQIVASLAVLYYASILASYAGARLGLSDPASAALTLLWAGACMLLLGIALHRVFLPAGILSLAAGALVTARPIEAGWVARGVPFVIAIGLVLVWGWPASRDGAQRARKPYASAQR